MRLAYITASFPFGRGEAFLAPEIESLVALGLDLWVIPVWPRGPRNSWECPGVTVVDGSLINGSILAGSVRTLWADPVGATGALRTLRDDLRRGPLARNIAVTAKGLWLADLVRRIGIDHIHAHWAATTATMARMASAATRVPYSLTLHRWDIVFANALAAKINDATFVRFVSRDGLNLTRAAGVEPPAEKTHVIPIGVAIPAQSAPRPSGDSFTILFVGRLIDIKGLPVLFEACRLLARKGRRFKVSIVGDGKNRKTLESAVKTVPYEVKFLGHVPHGSLLAMMTAMSTGVVVAPSLDLGRGNREGIPVSLMEAMARGIPVIATRTGGIPELVNEHNGLLVAAGDAEALADAIDLIMSDSVRADSLGHAGRQSVLEGFDVAEVANRLSSLFSN